MDQRTCNIIMCCKNNTKINPGAGAPFGDRGAMYQNVAAYMSRECGCPMEDYGEGLMERILEEALADYLRTADRPGADSHNLFGPAWIKNPTICDRIMNLFQLTKVRDQDAPVNGFTDALLAQSRKDLAYDGDPVVYYRENGKNPLRGHR